MTRFIEFETTDGESVFVEVDDGEVTPPPGVEKAGLRRRVDSAVATAEVTFEGAIQGIIRRNLDALNAAIRATVDPPSEIELTFGVKATGEVGNVAIARAGGEANFAVRVVWKLAAKE
jgi:hypothetical protein